MPKFELSSRVFTNPSIMNRVNSEIRDRLDSEYAWRGEV